MIWEKRGGWWLVGWLGFERDGGVERGREGGMVCGCVREEGERGRSRYVGEGGF